MAGSRFLRRAGRRLSVVIARRVQTNELFERPSERLRQPPVFDKDAKAANGDAASAPPDPDPQSEVPPPKNSEQCTIASLADIKQVLKGDGTSKIINHWATWCAPCIEELPQLVSLDEAVGNQAVVLGLSWDLFEGGRPKDVAVKVGAFSDQHGLKYPSLLVDVDPERFFSALDISYQKIPQTWVIDGNGDIVHRVEGLVDEAAAKEILDIVSAGQG